MAKNQRLFSKWLYRLPLFLAVLLIAGLSLLPFYRPPKASAGQILHRALTISSGVPGQTSVSYTFTFRTVTTTSPIAGIKLQACTTATGTYAGGSCTAPSGIHFDIASYNSGAQGGFTDSAAFSFDATGANDCAASASIICLTRSSSTNDTQTSSDKTIALTGITNPTSINTAFFVGITTYSTNNYTVGGRLDAGTTASAVVQTLTTSAAVAEILNFCVGSTAVDDATSSVANDCSGVSGTSLNLGTLDSSTINVSPVSTGGGDSKNGVVMLRTNATNGAAVYYDAIQQSGTNHQGTLRLSGAACNAGNVSTDPCINAAGSSQITFTAGTEDFGMDVNDNCGSTSNYACVSTGAAHSNNLNPVSAYLGGGTTGNPSYGTSNGFAWVENGTATQIASSTTVVDDEALILKFAATPAITTPTGIYTAQSDYIAVATY